MVPFAGLLALMAACLMLFQEKTTDMVAFFGHNTPPVFRAFLAIEPPPAVTTTLVSTTGVVTTVTATTTVYGGGYSAVVVTVSTPPASVPTANPLPQEPFPAFSWALWQTLDSCIPKFGSVRLHHLVEGLRDIGTALADAFAAWRQQIRDLLVTPTSSLPLWAEILRPFLSVPVRYPRLTLLHISLLVLVGAAREFNRQCARRRILRNRDRQSTEEEELSATRKEVAKVLDKYGSWIEGAGEKAVFYRLSEEMDEAISYAHGRLGREFDRVERRHLLHPVLSCSGFQKAWEAERAAVQAMLDKRFSFVLAFIYTQSRAVLTSMWEFNVFWADFLFWETVETFLPFCLLMSFLMLAFVLGGVVMVIGLVGTVSWLALMGTTFGACVARPMVEEAKSIFSEMLRLPPTSSTGNEGLSNQQGPEGVYTSW
ncbi:hypothetical protein AYL99_11360 [Fonsecaea erecta]|uniref:Uncharacterized protein n=1 Tax=Fonsecaea erecta TaxID=1367422 RepID=A0A178Z396_9EURO|nr:hypothetical protein AYL99_11360 [Fonsecaea erecta]OAP54259.1 hypothetical protein AYL99_11360 [Fonsecaea erecta]